MKQVLAFGDSLTWGADPVTALRHPHHQQWPMVLEAGLNGMARVHADGVGGRTTMRDDHGGPCSRNGVDALEVALISHMPLDLVILMLGTNDLKPMHGGMAVSAQAGMKRLVQIIQHMPYKPASAVPKILILAPPPVVIGREGAPAGARRIEESELLSPLYRAVAKEAGAAFFDTGLVAKSSPEDGVHLDAANTVAIGAALVPIVRDLLS